MVNGGLYLIKMMDGIIATIKCHMKREDLYSDES
jgi:hypothetical protein